MASNDPQQQLQQHQDVKSVGGDTLMLRNSDSVSSLRYELDMHQVQEIRNLNTLVGEIIQKQSGMEQKMTNQH